MLRKAVIEIKVQETKKLWSLDKVRKYQYVFSNLTKLLVTPWHVQESQQTLFWTRAFLYCWFFLKSHINHYEWTVENFEVWFGVSKFQHYNRVVESFVEFLTSLCKQKYNNFSQPKKNHKFWRCLAYFFNQF